MSKFDRDDSLFFRLLMILPWWVSLVIGVVWAGYLWYDANTPHPQVTTEINWYLLTAPLERMMALPILIVFGLLSVLIFFLQRRRD